MFDKDQNCVLRVGKIGYGYKKQSIMLGHDERIVGIVSRNVDTSSKNS